MVLQATPSQSRKNLIYLVLLLSSLLFLPILAELLHLLGKTVGLFSMIEET